MELRITEVRPLNKIELRSLNITATRVLIINLVRHEDNQYKYNKQQQK